MFIFSRHFALFFIIFNRKSQYFRQRKQFKAKAINKNNKTTLPGNGMQLFRSIRSIEILNTLQCQEKRKHESVKKLLKNMMLLKKILQYMVEYHFTKSGNLKWNYSLEQNISQRNAQSRASTPSLQSYIMKPFMFWSKWSSIVGFVQYGKSVCLREKVVAIGAWPQHSCKG